LKTRSWQRCLRCRVPAGQRRPGRRAGVDLVCSTHARVSAHAHAAARPCGGGGISRLRSRRSLAATSATFCSCSMASRPLSGSAARRVWRPAEALRGMGLRIVEPRASRDLLCTAELPLASATDDAHYRLGVFIIKHIRLSSGGWQSTLKPQRCSLSSSPLASLSSRHNSKCLSTLRSWISTTLLVRTDKRQGTPVLLTKKNFLLFRLFHCIVPALRGDCTVLWQSSDMFWEQRDCFVRKEGG
jgi:hypothetical protein